MISFSSLVSAVQGAIDQAVDMVARENIHSLLDYFEEEATDEDGEAVTKNISEVTRLSDLGKLEPKMVKLKYPKLTPNGPVEHHVSVPLLTLSPIPCLQLRDVEVEMDLELVEDSGEIMVGFPQANSSGESGVTQASKGGATKPNAKIKINVNANDRAAGVTALIEGYNKVLRAQLPN